MPSVTTPRVTEERIREALREVTDPELPVNLLDLGLVYRVAVHQGVVEVDLTFTSIGCPGMEMILDDVRGALLAVPGIERVELEVVWSPPWTKERLTPRGRRLLQTFGLSL